MNPYAIPSLICLCTMPILGTFIYSQNRRSQIHGLFLIHAVLISYWAFSEFNLRQADSYSEAYFWARIGCFKILLSPLLIHFILAYIGRWNEYDKLKAFILVYLPVILLSSLDLFSGAISGFPIKEYWGWSQGKPA
jgi:hypothetical protein